MSYSFYCVPASLAEIFVFNWRQDFQAHLTDPSAWRGWIFFSVLTCEPHLLRFTISRQRKRHIQKQLKELCLRNEVREGNFSLLPSTHLQYQSAGSQEVSNSSLWLKSYLRMVLCLIFLTYLSLLAGTYFLYEKTLEKYLYLHASPNPTPLHAKQDNSKLFKE